MFSSLSTSINGSLAIMLELLPFLMTLCFSNTFTPVVSQTSKTIMDLISWYAVSVISISFIPFTIGWLQLTSTNYSLLGYLGSLSILSPLPYVAINVALLYTGQSRNDLGRVSAQLAVINLMPTFLGGRTHILPDQLGVSLQNYRKIQYWSLGIAIIEAILHLIIEKDGQQLILSGTIVSIF